MEAGRVATSRDPRSAVKVSRVLSACEVLADVFAVLPLISFPGVAVYLHTLLAIQHLFHPIIVLERQLQRPLHVIHLRSQGGSA